MMHSSIKPKSPLGKLTIESIQLQLNKKSKGSHHFRYKTLPQNSHREIFMPKREIKKEVKAPLDQQLMKEKSISLPLHHGRWKSQEHKELFRIKSSIKLDQRKITTKDTLELEEQLFQVNIPRPVVVIKDFFQGKHSINSELPFFKQRSSNKLKGGLSLSKYAYEHRKNKDNSIISNLLSNKPSLPSIDTINGIKQPLPRLKVRPNLVNLEKCLSMIEHKHPSTRVDLSPWITSGQQTKEQFFLSP